MSTLFILFTVAARPSSTVDSLQQPAFLQIATGLEYPVSVKHAGDDSGRLFFVLQPGEIVVFDAGEVAPVPFLDIRNLVRSVGQEQGLLDVAFHPDYEMTGTFFVNYTREPDGATVVARYQVSGLDPNQADPNSGTPILVVLQPFTNHNGGQIAFGPDGYLYIALGDGGSSFDPGDRAQDSSQLLGKLLRIDVDDKDPGLEYAIPADNPFLDDGSARHEIWALGLRNPWRLSFDRNTGDLFLADVGQRNWEELNFRPAGSGGGENYEWPCREGDHDLDMTRAGCEDPIGTFTRPFHDYGHDPECSVTGGFRYRGTQNPVLSGAYIFGDWCSGRVWRADQIDGGGWQVAELADTSYRISTLGEDEAGELYLADWTSDGAIYRLALTIFSDVEPDHWARSFIEALWRSGLSAGCASDPLRFCPDAFVTRAEMAVFLKKGIHGSTYSPPTPDGSHPFNDIAGHWAEAWIEDLFDEGFTSGFPDGTYRPDNQVTRAEIAVFLKKAIHGSAYTSPAPDGSHPFSDVAGHWAEAWIEDLYDEGITTGFPDGTYRPENLATRAEMAVFLVNAFSLPLP